MALKIGVHAGPQNLTMDELVRLWRRCDDAGFHWISVWGHLAEGIQAAFWFGLAAVACGVLVSLLVPNLSPTRPGASHAAHPLDETGAE